MLTHYRNEEDDLSAALENLFAPKRLYDAQYGTHITDDLRLVLDEIQTSPYRRDRAAT